MEFGYLGKTDNCVRFTRFYLCYHCYAYKEIKTILNQMLQLLQNALQHVLMDQMQLYVFN